jgi:hypothetical protein
MGNDQGTRYYVSVFSCVLR